MAIAFVGGWHLHGGARRGLYAAGKLADLREMATHLSRKQISN
jgi:hypothetical protein